MMAVRTVTVASYASDGEAYSDSVLNLKPDGSAVFEFSWRGQRYTYEGREHADIKDKYVLSCPRLQGQMTLYRLPGEEGFVGRWHEKENGQGLWEIDFDD